MKPVRNTINFPYEIGAELAYINESGNEFEHGGIIVAEHTACRKNCYHDTCVHMVFMDTEGNKWCMIPEDFEEIE